MNMKGMRHLRIVSDFPNFNIVQRNGLINPVHIHALTVDSKGPHLELKGAGHIGLTFIKPSNRN